MTDPAKITAEDRFNRYWKDGGETRETCKQAFLLEIQQASAQAREEGFAEGKAAGK